MAKTWLRLYTDVPESEKLQLLPAEDFRTLVNLWCIAKDHGDALPSIAKVAWRLRMTVPELEETYRRFISQRLLEKRGSTYIPHDWTDHQYCSDSSTARVQRHRAKKSEGESTPETGEKNTNNNYVTVDVTAHETGCNGDETVTVTPRNGKCNGTEQIRAEQNRTEQNTPLPPIGEPTPVEIATDTIAEAHPKGVSKTLLAQTIIEQIRGPNEPATLATLRKNTLAWCQVWKEDPKHAPELLRWLRNGGWLKPPPAAVSPPGSDITDELIEQIFAEVRS